MRNLYIDFDGVILDTLPPVYKLAKQLNLDYKTQTKEMFTSLIINILCYKNHVSKDVRLM